jgi:hypothetical protein
MQYVRPYCDCSLRLTSFPLELSFFFQHANNCSLFVLETNNPLFRQEFLGEFNQEMSFSPLCCHPFSSLHLFREDGKKGDFNSPML